MGDKKNKLNSEKIELVNAYGPYNQAVWTSRGLTISNDLSALVIVESNGWSLATRIQERRCGIDLTKIAESLCIKYEKLNGLNNL